MTRIDRTTGGLEEFLLSQQAAFHRVFGSGPNPRIFFAPGRVNLMGAHLDYNGGPVMPTILDRGTYVLVRPSSGTRVRLASAREQGIESFEAGKLPSSARGSWMDYPLGVLHEFSKQAPVPALDLFVAGDLPVGVGLSSSASLTVAVALALDAMTDQCSSRLALVDQAWRAERDFVGVPCGRLDPHSIGLGRSGQVLWLDCKTEQHEHLKIGWEGTEWGIVNSGVTRAVAQSGYRERVRECEGALRSLRSTFPGLVCLGDLTREQFEASRDCLSDREQRRVKHVVTDVERTQRARQALLAGQPEEFGALMSASHRSLRDDYEVSCAELDAIVEFAARDERVFGGRMFGAGFGGSVVLLMRKGTRQELGARLAAELSATLGQDLELFGFGDGREAGELAAIPSGSPPGLG